jgi:hypothetical protein
MVSVLSASIFVLVCKVGTYLMYVHLNEFSE